MQRSINSLIDYDMGAIDGEIGKVEEFYFDDQAWVIRYLIVKTGSWLFGRKVLIAPAALLKVEWVPGTFPIGITKEQIRNSPDIDTDKPVSRQQEIEMYGHYPWQPYWGSGFYAGALWNVADTPPVIDEKIINQADNKGKIADEDPHLRSTLEVTGYNIHATDGEIGYVKDFIIDDHTWKLEYLVVDTHKWFEGKKVLIDVRHIKEVDWDKSKIFVDVTVDAIKTSKEIDISEFINSKAVNAAYDNYRK
jgi:sporulation protein YlmC with PRC-barrel domain